jgi:hypothetical protein
MNHFRLRIAPVYVMLALFAVFAGCSSSQNASTDNAGGYKTYGQISAASLDTIKARQFDGGRMWTFDYPPVDYFNQTYGFKPDQKWLDDVRMSALRFATYCSSSFVSADGLIMTNHHCARESVEKVSKEGEHLVENGFIATKFEDERKVPGLFVQQLVRIEDVTNQVHAAMDAVPADSAKLRARRDAISKIQEAGADKANNISCNVVTLYNGGMFSAYYYKQYNDVRLVFAPELQLGYFGGDDDNFTFPRFTYDCSFFRVYDEKGNPLKTEHYYKWSKNGAAENELTFVVGNPGSTSRLSTASQLAYQRDFSAPYMVALLDNRVEVLKRYAEKHPEKQEELINQIFEIANSQKANGGQLVGLRDDELMQRRRDFDRKFQAQVESRPELKAKYGHVWSEIEESRAKVREVAKDLYAMRMGGFGIADHFGKAMGLVRMATELRKPDAERDKSYKQSSLTLTKKTLGKAVTSESDMEELTLEKQLGVMIQFLGNDDPVIKMALKGRTPKEAARQMLSETILGDAAKVTALVEGAPQSVEESTDPFIAIVRLALPRYMHAVKVQRDVSERDEINRVLLGRAMFDVYGTSIPPDATFTLRLADGIVKGYPYNGTQSPIYTTFYGMFDRNESFKGKKWWDLPERWLKHGPDFKMGTPLNFIATNDIIGGNSGSPMINKNKEVIGLVFDGNMESLPGEYIFAEDKGNRTISVHSSGILEGLRGIYHLNRIADELVAGHIQK